MNHNGSNPAWVVLQGASASASTSYPSSKAATRSGTSHNNRITKEGYRLVDELSQNHRYPTREQKAETFARIQALPGCEHYTYANFNQKLASNRKKNEITPADILYPSLTRQAVTIHHLQILFREAPYPTPIQIQLWAERLGVEKNDIEAWVQLEQDKLQQTPNRTAVVQLPTPGSSCSPEPTSPITPTSPSYVHPALPPFAQGVHTKLVPKVESGTPTSPSCPVLPPLALVHKKPVLRVQPVENKPPGACMSRQQLQNLAEKVHVARTSSEAMPLSSEDAAKVLDAHAERMLGFIERYERGEYATLGLSPTLLEGRPVSLPLKAEPL